MDSLPPSPNPSGATVKLSTTVPPDVGRFAMLIPIDIIARLAIDAAANSGSEPHMKFIKESVFNKTLIGYFETVPDYIA